MRRPLKYQIMVPMSCVLLATLVLLSAVDAWLAGRRARQQLERQLRDTVETLGSATFPFSEPVLRQLRGLSGAEFVVARDSGQVLAASGAWHGASQLPAASQPGDAKSVSLQQRVEFSNGTYFHAAVRLLRPLPADQEVVLHLLYPVARYEQAWREAVLPPLALGLAALAVVIAVSSWLALRVTRPVQGLRDQVDRIARGDFVHVAVPPADDELRDLAIAVNHMVDMLARSEEHVRRQERLRTLDRLGGGIAHQLRNAVTGCRMAVDLHRRSCPKRDDESLAVATQQLDSMEEYLRRFLALGQRPAAPRCAVDLREAVTHVLPLVRPRAAHLQVTLECHLPATPVVIHGHAEALSQAVANLLLNAIEAAAHAGGPSHDGAARRVRVAAAPSGTTMARLEVWDTGNGPSEEIAQQLFEPLVSAKPGGVGLGLAIAREVADDHGGTICWYRQDNMTCFCMELPRWAAEAKNV